MNTIKRILRNPVRAALSAMSGSQQNASDTDVTPTRRKIYPAQSSIHPQTEPFSTAKLISDDIARLGALLLERGVHWVQLPQVGQLQPRIAIDVVDRQATLDVLDFLYVNENWKFRQYGKDGIAVRDRDLDQDALWAVSTGRLLKSAGGFELSTAASEITVEFWNRIDPGQELPDGSVCHEQTMVRGIDARGTAVLNISAQTWNQVAESRAPLKFPAPHILAPSFPVDIVFTWVDGSDSVWESRRAQYSDAQSESAPTHSSASHESRFTNRDELRYALRSIEAFAPWANHIFIVTDQQAPAWLNVDHPKVTVVDHTEIFADKSVLPVFNSHSIESQLHRIPGLAEHYLYMNDDVLFMRPVEKSMFFHANGIAKFFPATLPLDWAPVQSDDLPVVSAAKANRDLINADFGTFVSQRLRHTPHAQIKSLVQGLEDTHPDVFEQTAKNRFRSRDDYSIPSALVHWYGYSLGKAVPGRVKYSFADLDSPTLEQDLEKFSARRDLDILCVNETALTSGKEAEVAELAKAFFEYRFPWTSTFEKSS